MKVSDQYRLASKNESVYVTKIININDFREPRLKYLLDVYRNGEYQGEMFCGDSFFNDQAVTRLEDQK